jgi:Tfp pilus assembly protein PilV
MGKQKHFHKSDTGIRVAPSKGAANTEAGVGLIEAMIAAAIIAIAAVGIFSVLNFANQQNISAAQSWGSVQSAMTAWSQTPVTVNTQQSVAITVSGVTGSQTESVPVAETASGAASYGWWRSAP